ncbi:hypothetical protein BLD44_016860 [Mastigocladus laminosus UU774]|nr:MAG: hypothetical protein C6Y22_21600 [Hapalosiphonaceae cyanobacterium JJU2]TFI53026.1 hypothetical protein BLD44_016860 [Mastigocladus laminosus UU774]
MQIFFMTVGTIEDLISHQTASHPKNQSNQR